ncbi:MAG: PTS sugar transporter subunit IIA [Candidatus Aureabacteria bacterium]|nr:PTS sugar transporter subunit IIA [Candidatus Auribacterota bacterium]
MQLNVRDVAELFNVSEKTIYRWIQNRQMPAYKLHDQFRFNRSEIFEWATSRRVNISSEVLNDKENASIPVPSLKEALENGGIFYRINGKTTEEVLKSIIKIMRLPDDTDKDLLLTLLLAREKMAPTAIGDGIAIPHARNPIVLFVPKPMISLCFLENPVDFGALDGKPVHTVFTLITPTIQSHLTLLSKLAFCIKNDKFSRLLSKQDSREHILRELDYIESSLPDVPGSPATNTRIS